MLTLFSKLKYLCINKKYITNIFLTFKTEVPDKIVDINLS